MENVDAPYDLQGHQNTLLNMTLKKKRLSTNEPTINFVISDFIFLDLEFQVDTCFGSLGREWKRAEVGMKS
jgi:hypothetical protein